MPQRWEQARALYLEAEFVPPGARGEFLDRACAGDAALRAEVEALLGGDRSDTRITAPPTATDLAGTELEPGTRLGAWRITRLAGRGGMGEVYEAQRADDAFQLRAAIKLLKRGLDTAAVVDRFNRERRILARLEHPNIAHVLDAGVAPDGRPFLVMEYVEGVPVTDYARDRALAVAELLRLMITVCEAVQAAHALHIVHRDIKPSNVLVTPQGQVKLLDFGIAKALEDDGDGEVTRLGGSTAMTLAYAAPEQVLGLPATPASDVYALGCILYQLLVERLPHSRGGRTTHGIAGQLERETVERPSAVLRRERWRLPDALRLQRLRDLSGDLDLIALQALHAEAQRRYPDAHALAQDLERLLQNRPVLARPDSALYRIGRFVRRNRLPVTAAAGIVLALSVGLAAALTQARAALLARNEATDRRQQADDLINFMLDDLKERLEPVGRLDVLDAVSSKIAGYLTHGETLRLDNTSLEQRIRVLVQLTDLYYQRRQLDQHFARAAQAVAAARELVRRQPASQRASYLLASALRASATPLIENGKIDAAKAMVAEGLERSRTLLATRPDDPEAKFLNAYFLADTAYMADIREDYAPAVDNYLACAAQVKPLAMAAAARSDYISLYAQCMGTAADRLIHVRPAADAITAFQSLLAEERAALAGHEDDAVRLEQMQGVSAMATDTYSLLGRIDLATPTARDSVELGRRLLAHDPSNVDWKHAFAIALFTQARTQQAAGEWAALDRTCGELIALYEVERQATPQDTEVLRELIETYLFQAEALQHLGDTPGAIRQAEAAVALGGDSEAPRVAALVTTAWLRLWELNGGRSAHAADVARDTARRRIEHTQEHADQLSPHWRQQLQRSRMAYAYLSGDAAGGDRLYDELLAADPGGGFFLTINRNRYCERLGKRCGAAREWKPPA